MYFLRNGAIVREFDGAIIPENPGNFDYLAYLDWIQQGNTAQAEPPPAISLEEAKRAVRAQIKAFAASLRDAVIAPVSPGETAAWIHKEGEAVAFLEAGEAADAPMLTMEAQVRGVSLEVLSQMVIDNANAFRQMEAVIAGTRGKHDDMIESLSTVEAVLSYNWQAGWPNLTG